MKIKTIDNFLKEKDLKDLQSISLKKIGKEDVKIYHNSIDKNNNIKNDCIDKNFLIRLNKTYHEIALNILKELKPEKVELYDYSDFHIIETGANYKYPIHDDTPNKLLSGVIYLNPFKNSGTIFYETKSGKGKKIVELKINRAVFFCREDRSTWHSYEGDGLSNRIALVYNLMTNKVREVYKIEKKSYFFGQLRHKLNPYLYRFFKIVI